MSDVSAGRPRTLAEAVAARAADPTLLPIAGGTDLMVAMDADRRLATARVLDLMAIPELAGIREMADGGLEIGATTTFSAIRLSPLVAARYPALAAAAAMVGGWQIQNRATLGGNVANASPAGDSLPVLLALDAVAVAAGPTGQREIPYSELHSGYRRLALLPGELLVALRLPAPRPGTAQAFRKIGTREAQAISKVVVAMVAEVVDGTVVAARVAAGSVAATPVLLPAVGAALVGRRVDRDLALAAGELAAAAVTPIDDVRSTAEYRRFALAGVVSRLVAALAPA